MNETVAFELRIESGRGKERILQAEKIVGLWKKQACLNNRKKPVRLHYEEQDKRWENMIS